MGWQPISSDEKAPPAVDEPGLLTKILYRWGWSIPEEYRPWVERDVYSRAFWWWQLMSLSAAAAFVWFLAEPLTGSVQPTYMIVWVTSTILLAAFFKDHRRRRFLEWHEKRWTRARENQDLPDIRRFP